MSFLPPIRQRISVSHSFLAAALAVALLSTSSARSEQVAITVENAMPSGGFAITPVWMALHNGEFDVWSGGQLASEFPGLEELAEEGNTAPISEAFAASAAGQAGGVQATLAASDMAPPVFSPGEVAQQMLNVGDPTTNRFFSYASMVIPSNDLFFAVSIPTTYEIFDEDGNFRGPVTIEIYGRDVVDAGTELNDINGGAAFSANGGDATDESNPLADIYEVDPDASYLGTIQNTETATQRLVETVFGPDDLIARITITQIPTTMIDVSIENAMLPEGFFFTPAWIAAHNGSFDVWSGGEMASAFPGLEALAEEGDTSPLSASFATSDAGLAGGTQATVIAENRGAPVFSPGEAVNFRFAVGDPRVNRYFSYASMVIPSNDAFFAVSIPTSHEIFDENGNFNGPQTIEIFGRDIVDAGTEENNINAGAAFSSLGGEGTTENVPLSDLYARDPDANFLNSVLGTTTATNENIGLIFGPDDLVARITITRPPTPTVSVTVQNTAEAGGFFLTPFWVAAHDGRFDVWSGGDLAMNFPGLEELAEEGMTGPISAAFGNSASGLVGGRDATIVGDNVPAPVFSPGESKTFALEIGDPRLNRYFSYASMIIPSNDLFAAVSIPTTHEMFDAQGNFMGPFTIEIRGRDVVDAGTEENNIMGGAAFSVLGGDATDEQRALADIYEIDPNADYLQSIVSTETATGDTISRVFGPDDIIATITISQESPAIFQRGDANSDGRFDISDPVRMIGALFLGGTLDCEKAADVNDSGVVDISDPIWLLNFLFLSGGSPPAPYPACGVDPSDDLLTCGASLLCQ